MKESREAQPRFARALCVGQHNLPSWQRFETAFRDIFERRFFANGGPLVRELDARFALTLGLPHSVSVVNECVALMILLKALEIDGEVIIPALASPIVAQAVWWAGLRPVVCDVDSHTFMLSRSTVAPSIRESTVAVLAVRVFGRGDNSLELEELARETNIKLVFDSTSAALCASTGRRIGGFGNGEVFSFHSRNIINAAEGGSITTSDDALASKMRTIRNFYMPAEPVRLRINGKMAEAPAALALLGLEDAPVIIARNRKTYGLYAAELANIAGISVVNVGNGGENNYQSVIVLVDADLFGMTAAALQMLLRHENAYCERPFQQSVHHWKHAGFLERQSKRECPISDRLCEQFLQLPSGRGVEEEDVIGLCELIRNVGTRRRLVVTKVNTI